MPILASNLCIQVALQLENNFELLLLHFDIILLKNESTDRFAKEFVFSFVCLCTGFPESAAVRISAKSQHPVGNESRVDCAQNSMKLLLWTISLLFNQYFNNFLPVSLN